MIGGAANRRVDWLSREQLCGQGPPVLLVANASSGIGERDPRCIGRRLIVVGWGATGDSALLILGALEKMTSADDTAFQPYRLASGPNIDIIAAPVWTLELALYCGYGVLIALAFRASQFFYYAHLLCRPRSVSKTGPPPAARKASPQGGQAR